MTCYANRCCYIRSILPILKRGLGLFGISPLGSDELLWFECLLVVRLHSLNELELKYGLKLTMDLYCFCALNLHRSFPDELSHFRFHNAHL
ncbi:hypothetical protein KR51_00014010 [Rubidibacter lacunae KORDI 51-2]|uniref:Uncharacterized protein n=1 Tax=Rubidibacter lacunae KORDI 51-2 TaxID=582515 RepID=U5DQW3_9CHRO|nr:hypothetical protein KR51_00014010 [Rubidibacter lacunae KORDI 51-2]